MKMGATLSMLAILLLKMPSSKAIICTLYFGFLVGNHANCLKDPEFQTTKLPISHLPTRRVTSAHLNSPFPKKTKARCFRSSTPCSIRLCFSSKTFLAEFRDLSIWARGAEIHGFNLSNSCLSKWKRTSQ